MILAAAHAAQQSQTLGTFIFSVASGLMVVLLAYLTTSIRRFLRQHYWLVETVNKNTEAIEKQGKAIETLLSEHRPAKVPARAGPRRGRT